VLLLANFYIAYFNERLRKRVNGLTPEVRKVFLAYHWPGNVRELRNVIERVMILEEAELITTDWLPRDLDKADLVAPNAGAFRLPDQGTDLERVEFSLVRQAMDRSSGNQTRAAELLGISRDQLRYRLKKIAESQSEY